MQIPTDPFQIRINLLCPPAHQLQSPTYCDHRLSSKLVSLELALKTPTSSFSCLVASTMTAPPRIQSFLFLLCARQWLHSPIQDPQTRPQAGQVLLSSPLSVMGMDFFAFLAARLSSASSLLLDSKCAIPCAMVDLQEVRSTAIISQLSTLISQLFRDCFRVSLYRLR